MNRERVTIERHPVKSSNVVGYGYKDSVLEIEYNGGGVYQYSGVSESVYNKLCEAASAGSFVAKHIKGKYKATQVQQ